MPKYETPDVADCIKCTVHRGNANWYVVVSVDKTGPKEVWITSPHQNRTEMKRERSNAQVISGLAQLAFEKGATAKEVDGVFEFGIMEGAPEETEAVIIEEALTKCTGVER